MNSEEIPERITSENRLFEIVRRNKGEEWNIAYAGQVCTEKKFKTAKNAEMYINNKPWDLLCVVGMINANIMYQNMKMEEFQKEAKMSYNKGLVSKEE